MRAFPRLEVRVTVADESGEPIRRFSIDREAARQDASERLELTGWALVAGDPVARVTLHRGGHPVASTAPDRDRPRLRERFPKLAGDSPAGFRLTLESPPAGAYRLVAESAAGRSFTLADIELARRDSPRVLFMHIAKAAGSSVNTWLASHYPPDRCAVHVESHPDWPRRAGQLASLDFVSGHVALHALDRHLDLARWYSLAVVRDPWAQLASHIAWIRRLSERGEEKRLAKHPEVIRQLSARLKAVNFRSARSIRAWWDGENGAGPGQAALRLLDNCQVRYFTPIEAGQSVTEADAARAIEASARIDRIGDIANIDHFFAGVAADMGWPVPRRLPRENVTADFYGLDVTRPRIRQVLEPLVRQDLALYEHLRALGSE